MGRLPLPEGKMIEDEDFEELMGLPPDTENPGPQREPVDTTSDLEPRYTEPDLPGPVELKKQETWYFKIREFFRVIFSSALAGIEEAKKKTEKTRWAKFWNVALKIITILAGLFGLKK